MSETEAKVSAASRFKGARIKVAYRVAAFG